MHNILQDVQTLVLDGLSVTADIVSDILTQSQYNVRILSIREVSHLNERKLQQALLYAIRPSRPENTPKIQGIYIFGPKAARPVAKARRHVHQYPAGIDPSYSSSGVMHSRGAQIGAQWNEKSGDALAEEIVRGADKWYSGCGKVITKIPSVQWSQTLHACRGLIGFDAVMCNGPRHKYPLAGDKSQAIWYEQDSAYLEPRIATYSMKGCHGCGSAPEMFSKFGTSSLDRFPLLAPPPILSSTIKVAKAPFAGSPDKLLVRCSDCLRGRYCESCQKWWCENCYEIPNHVQAPGSPQRRASGDAGEGHAEQKVYMGLCVEECLVTEMMSGAGSNGMWG